MVNKRVLSIKVSLDNIVLGKWNSGNISLRRMRDAIKTVKEELFFYVFKWIMEFSNHDGI